MSKTYEALIKAEQLRAAQDPAALARRVARAAEEGEALRVELRASQEQLTELIKRVDAVAHIDPVALDDLGRQVAQLAEQQQRLAAEPRQLLEATMRQWKEDLDPRWAALQRQADQVADLSLRLEEVQGNVVPALETLRNGLDELRRRGDELQTERQVLVEELEHLSETMARALSSVDEQQGEQRRLLQELAELRAAQEDGRRRTQRLAEEQERQQQLADAVRRAQESSEETARRLAELDDAQASSAETLRREIDELRESLLEKVDAAQQLAEAAKRMPPAAEKAPRRRATSGDEPSAKKMKELRQQMDELRASLLERVSAVETAVAEPPRSMSEVEELRARVATLAEFQVQQQPLAEGVERAQAIAEEAAQRITAIDAAHASSLAPLRRQIAELQTDGAALRDALGALQSSLADQSKLAAGLEALRTQVGPLVEAQARQSEMAGAVSRAQSTADEVGQRIAVHEEAQGSALAALRQQLQRLQAESESWQNIDIAVQAVLARQEDTAGEVEALQAKLARMVEAQEQLQQLLEDLLVVPAAGEGQGATALDSEGSAELANLRRQVIALQADRLKLNAFLDARFELLCEILDAELQEKVDELRGGAPAPIEAEGFARKILPEALLRGASSLARLRKKAR